MTPHLISTPFIQLSTYWVPGAVSGLGDEEHLTSDGELSVSSSYRQCTPWEGIMRIHLPAFTLI